MRPRWRTNISTRVLAASRRSRPRMRTGRPCERWRSGPEGAARPAAAGGHDRSRGGRHGEQPNQRSSRQKSPCDPHDGEGDHQKPRFVDVPRGTRVGLRRWRVRIRRWNERAHVDGLRDHRVDLAPLALPLLEHPHGHLLLARRQVHVGGRGARGLEDAWISVEVPLDRRKAVRGRQHGVVGRRHPHGGRRRRNREIGFRGSGGRRGRERQPGDHSEQGDRGCSSHSDEAAGGGIQVLSRGSGLAGR